MVASDLQEPQAADPVRGALAERTSVKKERILAFIRTYISEHGYAPSLRDIVAGAKLSSISIAAYHLTILEEEGKITRTRKVARSIRIT